VVSNLALLVDLWQWRVGGGTLDQLRELSPDQIVMVRLADIPDDEPMDAIEDTKRLLPGATGVVDCAGALRVLSEIGYEGPVAAFPHPSQLKGQTRDRIVQRTADALDELWKTADLEVGGSRLTPITG
jgi:sugar phosphate isomerase/epimerase